MDEIVEKIRVKNELGLHTRPATSIVKLLQNSKSEVSFTYRKETANAKSILSILMLAVTKNGMLTVKVKGKDALETMESLKQAFDECFGED